MGLLTEEQYKKIAEHLHRTGIDDQFRWAADEIYKEEGSFDFFFSDEFKKELKENEYIDVERVNEMYEEALQLEREGKIK